MIFAIAVSDVLLCHDSARAMEEVVGNEVGKRIKMGLSKSVGTKLGTELKGAQQGVGVRLRTMRAEVAKEVGEGCQEEGGGGREEERRRPWWE